MKRVALLALLVLIVILVACGPRQAKVEKRIENGVEVVLNHKEPYVIPGQPTRLVLEKELEISTGNEELAKAGFTDMETFDVDSEGNIYIILWHVTGNHIYKFDKDGRLLVLFAQGGQGPGEIEWGGMVKVTSSGEIIAKDPSVRQLLFFSPEGRFLRQIQLPRDLEIFARFADGTYLTWMQNRTADLASYIDRFVLCGPEFKEEKEVFRLIRPASQPGQARTVGEMAWVHANSAVSIVIGDSREGYDLRVFSREGRPIRRIRKEFEPMPITAEYKSDYLGRIPENAPWRNGLEFAKNWPPFQYAFADDAGHLFVMTREVGLKKGEFMYDIFNADGVFICRTSLGNSDGNYPRDAKVFRGRLYSIDVNDDGYKVLDVFRMRWEKAPAK
jgi:hypothetical protein